MNLERAKKIAKQYIAFLKNNDIPVTHAYLFGSYAKGTAHEGSDIDISIVSPRFGKDRIYERTKLLNLRRSISLEIEPHPLSPSDMKSEWNPLVWEIKSHGIAIKS
ncbi:MAG: nucleotidyltransferase domain-containing protein [Candidatus Roizmanbacteria bacterium]|uniref:Nucleotidyltransferase n=1 Tax=Candidatus Roizmanbacteria bacterium CG_4_9_14_0_2_um_filter_39_13 TaxID=1974839 RepID=A0A2M8F2W3_9BACT|nr:nucleotidyltransferase domain-containing protein [Candidatus Roizmanbacteria bacterium]PIZ64228.1 MAG: nucleotidyltransferase [Candidatus Roizmanbacteria bacterium CG_4_10_14_0_2_um_filter_39_12]PJC33625.1 MAG: nucleotidyltransferase [Candidatus Roizmanbacteria bacterium CG_4_9_14_0_2_um_filter_39_13]